LTPPVLGHMPEAPAAVEVQADSAPAIEQCLGSFGNFADTTRN
jgi:hypothetical protein